LQFNTIQYFCFLPLIVLLYYVLPAKLRLSVLLVASYLFYASWDPVFLLLIIGLTILNYFLGRGIQQARQFQKDRAASWLLALSIALNLGTLIFYKYILFLLESLSAVISLSGSRVTLPAPSLILPLGISFFVFEFIHYQVDVWRKEPVVGSLLKFAIFAAFFPTQIAGPIKRYENFVPQLAQRVPFNLSRAGQGVRLLIFGLFKKVVLADNLAPLVILGFNQVQPGNSTLGQSDAILVVLAFTMQIYFDFSGYTDMGRGSALLLGFQVPENFLRPYLSTNISEFWRRWHISLSTWLRDYLYIPLGGNRRGRYRNLMVTMVLGGLWHGANWTFIAWGALHGVLLSLYWYSRSIKLLTAVKQRLGKLPLLVLGWAFTFGLVCVGWVFFRAANFQQALSMLGSALGISPGGAELLVTLERLFIVLVVVGCLGLELALEQRERLVARREPAAGDTPNRLEAVLKILQPSGLILLIALIVLFRPTENTRFIYFQF
jgi:alginate O-acetyltransferase complex protein AlgI